MEHSDYVRALGALVLDHRFRRLTEALLRAADAVYEAEGLPFRARWASTFRLVRAEGPVAITDLAARLRLSHPAVIAIVQDMQAAGLLADARDRDDGRRRLVALTAAGRRLGPRLERVWAALADAQRERFADAGCDVVAVLNRVDDGLAARGLADEVRERLAASAAPVARRPRASPAAGRGARTRAGIALLAALAGAAGDAPAQAASAQPASVQAASVQAASAPAGQPATPFDPPAQTVLAGRAVTVPLTETAGFYYLDVQLNGRPFRFTLETGAGFFAVSGRAARALGLRVDSVEVVPGTRAPVGRVDSLRVGGALFRGLTARLVPAWDDAEFDGILSVPVLRDVLATLDLTGGTLRLERGALPAPNGRDVLAFAGADRGGRIDVPVRLGGVSLPAVLDTRSSFWLIAPDSVEAQLRPSSVPRFVTRARGPALGTFELRGARLADSLGVGPLVVERPVVLLRNRPGVVLGVPLLEQVVVTIDQRTRRLRLTLRQRDRVVRIPRQPSRASVRAA